MQKGIEVGMWKREGKSRRWGWKDHPKWGRGGMQLFEESKRKKVANFLNFYFGWLPFVRCGLCFIEFRVE
uniref:Uncharacterized protein n=1 Tax=Manihot esculenta TaxID=3983 RepID=A0A2C9WNT4_MANES